MQFLQCILVLGTSIILVSSAEMDTVYKWKYVDYVWKSEADRQKAIDSHDYNFTKVMPMDVEKAKDGRVFITMVGRPGVPVVLGTVTDQMGPSESGPLVKPYPDWTYYEKGNCDSIQNVYRIALDECERLWVLDTGMVQEATQRTCPPQLLSFDLKTDRLVHRIKIPKKYVKKDSLFVTPIVETKGKQCEDTNVYMADALEYGLVIWKNGKFSRLEGSAFGPSENATHITSGNYSVDWETGIVTMALSPSVFPNEPRFLHFHSLASYDLYSQTTGALKSSTNGKNIGYMVADHIFTSQAVGVAFSSEATLFMGLTKENAIACCNKYRGLKRDCGKIVAKDDKRLEYVNSLKVIPVPKSNDEELWAVSNRLVTYTNGKMNYDDYNFRVLKGSVKKLIAGTTCELPRETQLALEEINKEDGRLIFN